MLSTATSVVKTVAANPTARKVATHTVAFAAGYKATNVALYVQLRRSAKQNKLPNSVKI